MSPPILRDLDATQKLLEAILDTPGGKRTLSKLARTCRAISEPALDILWRDLDSLVPVIGLFPSNMLKKARKPGLGLSRPPAEEDWDKITKYGERVRSLTYSESANNVASSIFPMLDQRHRPSEYMFPRLQKLTWKAETAVALEYCNMFLSPGIESVHFELGAFRSPSVNRIFGDICNRMKLTAFSIVSATSLPDTFTVMLSSQKTLQKVALVAPGALSSGVGRWAATLPALTSLQLDLSGRTLTAVEGFFDELPSSSGDSTPSSVATTDSGVFSGEELDFSDIRKSAMRLTGDLKSNGAFPNLRQLHLTGDVSNIAVFMKHFSSPLIQLDLVIDDPPDQTEWMELSFVICERFGSSLQGLRISATLGSKFNDLVRSTSRAGPTSSLSLEHLSLLPALRRLEIDLPESINFTAEDIEQISTCCPNIEELKLCPLARFPTGPPKLSLEALAPLAERCHKLHTLSIPVNARRAGSSVLDSQTTASESLRRLHVGHSWVHDTLHVAILLSHLAPYLDSIKWFHEKNRPGYIETNARGWEKVADTLPHLQNIRLTERNARRPDPAPKVVYPTPPPPPVPVETAEKAVMATVVLIHQGVLVKPSMNEYAIQFSGPPMVDESVGVHPEMSSVAIDAIPQIEDVAVEAIVQVSDQSIDAIPETNATSVDATPTSATSSVLQALSTRERSSVFHPASYPNMLLPIFSLISFTCRVLIAYPMSIPVRLLHVMLDHMPTVRRPQKGAEGASSNGDVSMSALQVRQS